MRYGMVIDLRRCVGCQACTVACKIENGTPPDHYWARVYTEEEGTYPNVRTTYVPVLCNHCENAICVQNCPTRATYRRPVGIGKCRRQPHLIAQIVAIHRSPHGHRPRPDNAGNRRPPRHNWPGRPA